METTSQSRLVWMYSRVLMMLRPLTNCCVLAARRHVNGSTCDCKLHRGAMELTEPSVYLGHNTSICMFVGMLRCGVMPMHFNVGSFECAFLYISVHVVVVLGLCRVIKVEVQLTIE